MKNISLKFISLVIVFTLSASTVLSIGKTFAFFDDSASSNNNVFQAGAWVPVFTTIGNQMGVEGQLLEFTVAATDPNGDPLTYSASNLPTNATFIGQTFYWTPQIGDAGVYLDVLFEVSDGEYIDSENITITIAEAPAVEIFNIRVDNKTSNSAIISWQTSELVTSSVVVYGLAENDYASTSSEAILDSGSYNVQLESLSADTLYHFRVKIIDNLGREGFSGDNIFHD